MSSFIPTRSTWPKGHNAVDAFWAPVRHFTHCSSLPPDLWIALWCFETWHLQVSWFDMFFAWNIRKQFFFWNIAQTEAFTQPVFFVRHVDIKRYYNKGNLKIVELFIIIPLVVVLYLQATRMFVIGSFSLQARSGLTLLLGVLVFHMFVHLYKAHSCQVGNLFFVVQFPNTVSQQEKKDIGKVFCSSISLSYLLSVRVSPSMYGHISYLTSIQTLTYHKLCGAGIYVLVFSCWAISYF